MLDFGLIRAWLLSSQVSVFREPAFEKNALHKYLDNEDAEVNANTAESGGGYVGAGGFGGGGGWGRARAGDGDEKRQEEDEEMEVEEEVGHFVHALKQALFCFGIVLVFLCVFSSRCCCCFSQWPLSRI